MTTPIHTFISAIDKGWKGHDGPKITFKVIGSTALMLQADYTRATNDSDVLETSEIDGTTNARLKALAGKGTVLHQRHRLYLDIVANGIPFLPLAPLFHPVADLSESLRWFNIEVLDIQDVAVSKLKRFNARDAGDILAMVERGLVDSDHLVERFRSAAERFSGDARAEHLPTYLENLNTVRREFFFEKDLWIQFD